MRAWRLRSLWAFFLVTSCSGAPPPASPGVAPPAAAMPVPSLAAATAPPPREDGRLPGTASPTEYRLELAVTPSEPAFSGKVRIGLRLDAPTRFIVLHGRKLRIRSARVTSGGDAQAATVAVRAAWKSKGDPDELVVTTPHAVPAGVAALDVEYDADFSEGLNGLYRVNASGAFHAFSQFEPVGARLAFPCFDEPSAKVPFEISVTVPAGLVALSNMPGKERATLTPGRRTFDFERSPPLPTYLVAFAVGPLEIREAKAAGAVPLRLAAVAGRAAEGSLALDTAASHLAVLEAYFGTKYPYPKLDLVAVPDFSSGAMENAGLITFREERLLVDERTAPTSMRRALFNVVAHELSHMWFGDLVTMKWWNDIWLNEGFATWMATRVLDTWRPELGAAVEALGSTGAALHADTLDSARRVRQGVGSTTEALEAFDGITYVKGAALLGMVETWLSKEIFRAGIVQYLAAHRFGNATSEDLFAALSAASGKDVQAVLSSFTDQTGVPRVQLGECRLEGGVPTVPLSQEEYRPLGAGPITARKLWRFPVCVHVSGQKSGERACTLLDRETGSLPLPGAACPAWVYPNADQTGYYRSTLPARDLTALAALPPATLSARERVGLLSDAWAQVSSGALGAGEFIELARHFRGDREAVVWEKIVSALDVLHEDVVSERDRPLLEAAARGLLSAEASALGWAARPHDGDSERMRRRLLLTALGNVGRAPAVLERARIIAARFLADPASVDGDQAAVALPVAARAGDAALFDRFVARLKSARTPAERVLCVTALGAFTDAALVRRALGLLLDGTVRAQDQAYVVAGLFGREATRRVAFSVVAERPEAFLSLVPPFARRRIVPLLARSCAPDERERVRALIAPRLSSLEGADRGFAQALEEGDRCAALRAHQQKDLERFLRR